jgi:hypothetical protein
VADNVKFIHRLNKSGGEPIRMTMNVVGDWFKAHPAIVSPVVLNHFALELTYYTGLPSVKIPTNDPLDKVLEIADHYRCTHLVLIGDQEAVFRPLYNGQTSPRFRRLDQLRYTVPLENGGEYIQVYEILQAVKRNL